MPTGSPTWLITAPTGPTTGAAVIELAQLLTDWLFVGFMLLAVVFIILAAWQFISGGGDPQQVGQARSKLFWAAVAIAAAMLARGIPVAISGIIGA